VEATVPETATAPLHRTPDDYHVIRPEDFGAPGLWAREAVGPFVDVQALGTLVTVHDSRFEAGCGIGHHPHQRMERLFYILEGTVDHDDALNHITGHMGAGDLGVLTEGRRGMIHSEWNHGDGPARAYIFVYPNDPLEPAASFDAIRDGEAPRRTPAPGVETKGVVERGSGRLHGDFRALGDSALAAEATLEMRLQAGEAGLCFVVAGGVDIDEDHGARAALGLDHTLLIPPAPTPRTLRVTGREPSRVLHAVTGEGYGLRRR
jgi:redox-sensitive bicupin YhaK (pirin superfamily)